MPRANRSRPFPLPTTTRRVWVPGIIYTGETEAQAAAREAQCRADDARADAEERRLAEWKARPWWVDPPPR